MTYKNLVKNNEQTHRFWRRACSINTKNSRFFPNYLSIARGALIAACAAARRAIGTRNGEQET